MFLNGIAADMDMAVKGVCNNFCLFSTYSVIVSTEVQRLFEHRHVDVFFICIPSL